MQHFFKTTALLILLTLNLQSLVRAQPEWQWGIRGNINAGSGDRIADMTTDPNGNLYIVAGFLNQGDVHGQALNGYGFTDMVVASFTCDGAFRWKKNIGSSGAEIAVAIKADTLGNVYVLGNTTSTTPLHIDNDTLITGTNKSIFVIKYDTSGSFKWLRMPQPDTVTHSTSRISYGIDMDVDGAGNIFVFSNLFPGHYGASPGHVVASRSVHILKYNKDGLFTGGLALAMTTNEYQNYFNVTTTPRMKRDHARDRYYFSRFLTKGQPTDYLRFGTTEITDRSAYIACHDGTGSALWVKQSFSPVSGALVYQSPAIDPQGNIYIGGSILPGSTWDGHTFTNSIGLSQVPFVMKKDLNGNNVWVVNGATIGSTGGVGIGYSNNRVLLHGHYPLTLDWGNGFVVASPPNTGVSQYLVQLDAQSGTVLRLDSLKSSLGGLAYTSDGQLITDSRGNAFMSARFNASVSVAGTNLGASSEYDWMLAKFGTDNCNCTMPAAAFTSTNSSGTTVNFTYTGTTPYTGISWDFGNGSAPATTANPSHTYAANGSYTVCVTVTNDCGSHTFCNPVQAGGTGIENIPGLAGVKIYPNPAAHSITIEQAMPGTTMELYGTTGQRLSTKNINNPKEQIDIQDLPQGIYLIRLTTKDGHQATTRFIKQ